MVRLCLPFGEPYLEEIEPCDREDPAGNGEEKDGQGRQHETCDGRDRQHVERAER
jgi:hypothetical protein